VDWIMGGAWVGVLGMRLGLNLDLDEGIYIRRRIALVGISDIIMDNRGVYLGGY
jgi:hypothetical protein